MAERSQAEIAATGNEHQSMCGHFERYDTCQKNAECNQKPWSMSKRAVGDKERRKTGNTQTDKNRDIVDKRKRKRSDECNEKKLLYSTAGINIGKERP